jgi:pyroglutamyl-peptidase
MAWPRVLVTGFGPFPGAPENPSAWLIEALRAERPFPGAELHARTLPTEWSAVADLAPRLYAGLQPHVMIHFGLCQRAESFRIERSAFNHTQPRADAGAALPLARHVLPAAPERLDTRLPVAALASHLKARGIAASVSPSAGRYLCNYLYYLSLDWAAGQPKPPLVLFVHIPQRSRHVGAFTDAMLLHGALETVRFVFAHHESAARDLASAALTPSLLVPELLTEDDPW